LVCDITQTGGNLLAFRGYLLPPTTDLKMEVVHSSIPTVNLQHTSNSIFDEIYWPFSAEYLKKINSFFTICSHYFTRQQSHKHVKCPFVDGTV
jgi:hypothetical protein